MLVGLHRTYYKGLGGFTPFVERFVTILSHNDIPYIRLDASAPDFWDRLKSLDLLIYWWSHEYNEQQAAMTILPVAAGTLGVKCLPDVQAGWLFDDKIRQAYFFENNGCPIIPSWVFWDKRKALEWAQKATYPVVFKLKGGAGSRNVILVRTKRQAVSLIRRMFGRGVKSTDWLRGSPRWADLSLRKITRHRLGLLVRRFRNANTKPPCEYHKNYIMFQRFVPANEFDTRVTVIGDRAFAFRRFNRPGDFRSSGSGSIDYRPEEIDIAFVKKALEISKHFGFRSMAYDFLYDVDGTPLFCESSYGYVDEAVYACPGFWDLQLQWHDGHFWPQHCMLMDALQNPQLQVPEILKNT